MDVVDFILGAVCGVASALMLLKGLPAIVFIFMLPFLPKKGPLKK